MVRVTGRPDFVLSCESKKYESLWGYSLGFIGQSLPRSAVFGESSVTSCRMWVLTTHRRSSPVGWDILQSLDQSEGVGSSPGRHSASPPRLPKQHLILCRISPLIAPQSIGSEDVRYGLTQRHTLFVHRCRSEPSSDAFKGNPTTLATTLFQDERDTGDE